MTSKIDVREKTIIQALADLKLNPFKRLLFNVFSERLTSSIREQLINSFIDDLCKVERTGTGVNFDIWCEKSKETIKLIVPYIKKMIAQNYKVKDLITVFLNYRALYVLFYSDFHQLMLDDDTPLTSESKGLKSVLDCLPAFTPVLDLDSLHYLDKNLAISQDEFQKLLKDRIDTANQDYVMQTLHINSFLVKYFEIEK